MFFNKKFRDMDKTIVQENDYIVDSEDNAVINIKATSPEQIFSSYNYDNNEKLNDELNSFIIEKAKFVPVNQDIKIKLYTSQETNEKDVKTALKNNYKKEYVETKNAMKRNFIFSGSMLFIGVVFLVFLILMHNFFYNIILETILEITTWVFVWEAIDSFFLERFELKRKRITFLKLYHADIEVVKLKNIKNLEKDKKQTINN